MTRTFIADTGPIVALLNARDRHHAWAREMFDSVSPPLSTCEAVISEACFLLRRLKGGPTAVMRLLDRGVLDLPFRLAAQHVEVRTLQEKFDDVPMSLADACLVRMSELEPAATVLTIDTDFKVYRRHGRHVIPVAIPD